MNYEKTVKEFHDAFRLPVSDEPVQLSKEQIILRIKLMREELDELEDALYNGDINHQAKEWCDLQYTVSGTALEMGIWNRTKEIFGEVHRSNMSKIHYDWSDFPHGAAHFDLGPGNGFVLFDAYGKVVKPSTYSPADIQLTPKN